MPTSWCLWGLLLAGGLTTSFAAGATYHQPPHDATIWNGVYTAEQAQRGQKSYEKFCGYCHRDNLEGDEGPSLVGSPFTLRWRNHTLDDMYTTIQDTMPQDAPGTLSAQAYADIVSYLLKMNGAPTGSQELPAKSAELARIRFTDKP